MTQMYHEWDADVLIRPEWPFDDGAIRKIGEFKELPNGWHCGEGVPLDPAVADFADSLITVLSFKGISNIDVFPRPNGGIELHVYGLSGHVELFIDSSYTFDYLKSDADDRIVDDGEDVPWERAISVILEAFKTDLMSSERSRPARGGSPKKTDFLLMHSPHRLMAQVFRCSMSLAPWSVAAPFVNTFRNTMHVQSMIHQPTW